MLGGDAEKGSGGEVPDAGGGGFVVFGDLVPGDFVFLGSIGITDSRRGVSVVCLRCGEEGRE